MEFLVLKLISIFTDQSTDQIDQHYLLKAIERILLRFPGKMKMYLQKLLTLIQPFVSDENFLVRLQAREFISSIAKAASLSDVIQALRGQMDSNEALERENIGTIFAILSLAIGSEKLLPFLKAVCKTQKSPLIRNTGLKIIYYTIKFSNKRIKTLA